MPWKETSVMDDVMSPEQVLAAFEERVDAVFRADAGKPLVRHEKKPPLLNADNDSGVVTISKGSRKKVLDFNEAAEAGE